MLIRYLKNHVTHRRGSEAELPETEALRLIDDGVAIAIADIPGIEQPIFPERGAEKPEEEEPDALPEDT